MPQPSGEDLIRISDKAFSDRVNWDSLWQETARYFMPDWEMSFNPNGLMRTEGTKNNRDLYDATGGIALGRFTSVLDSMMTPKNSKWHSLMASARMLMGSRNVRLWFEESSNMLFRYRYAPKAGFHGQNTQNYTSIGLIGNCAMFTDALQGEPGLRYKSIPMGEVAWRENHQGVVDTFIRRFKLTARQILQRWGERAPAYAKDAATGNKADDKFDFYHHVCPRTDYEYGNLGGKGKLWASYYIDKRGMDILEEGGYNSFPYAISRYSQSPGELYGRGPAQIVLPSNKTLQEMKKTILKQGQRTVDPILLTHDDGILDTLSLRPGSNVAGGMSADGRPLVGTLPIGNISIGKELMDDERSAINDVFLVTLFQLLKETPRMTATEVIELAREKGILLAPTMGRIEAEYLGPLIERELDVLATQGLLPPMPQELIEAQGEYRVQYDSPLARAARAEETGGAMRVIEILSNAASITQDPSILDPLDWDVMTPEIAEQQAMPLHWIASDEKIAAKREQRAQAQQTQMAMQAAPSLVSGIKAVADAGNPAPRAA